MYRPQEFSENGKAEECLKI